MTPPNTRWDVWTAFAGPKYVHAVYDIACIAPDYEGDLSNASFVNMLFATGWWKADGYTPCDDEIRDALGWILLFEESRDPELGKRPEKDPILVPLAGWRVDPQSGRAFPRAEVQLRYIPNGSHRKMMVALNPLTRREMHLEGGLGIRLFGSGLPSAWKGPRYFSIEAPHE